MLRLLLIVSMLLVNVSCYTSTGTGDSSTSRNNEQERLDNQKQMAVASVRRGNFKQALKDIEKAKEIDDDDPGVHFVYGIIYYALKDYDKAENYYKKAIEEDKEYTQARYNLCGLYLTVKKYDKAIEQCLIAAEDPLYQARASAYTNLGIAHFRKGDVNTAKKYYDRALDINPSLVYAHNELGKLYLSIGDEKKAINEFKLAISGYEEYDEAYFNLGTAYLKKGDKLSACHAFRETARISPNSEIGLKAKNYINTVCETSY